MPDNSFLEGITHEGLKAVLETVQFRDGHQKEFLNAVHEVAISLQPLLEEDESWLVQFERLCEPERTIIFRVPWLDDNNDLRINRGVRVQFSSAIGPYKGGLRFHPTFRLSIAKMLAFEQCFKNALTGLPLGAGKGGSDFDPKGKSDGEIQRFCQSFMTELIRYIDDDVDVPAGDIGVGTKEIGYLFGQYKRISGRFQPGVLTGKGIGWGGSWCRPEATGYGVVYITQEVLADREDSLKGKRCLVSGSGNVALHCAKKLVEEGAVVLSVSDSGGSLLAPEGLSAEVVDEIQKLKSNHNGRLADFKASDGIKYFGDKYVCAAPILDMLTWTCSSPIPTCF
jgi:glutamate dehydrogenase (NADP+)